MRIRAAIQDLAKWNASNGKDKEDLSQKQLVRQEASLLARLIELGWVKNALTRSKGKQTEINEDVMALSPLWDRYTQTVSTIILRLSGMDKGDYFF